MDPRKVIDDGVEIQPMQELASLVTDEERQALFRELTTILTRRWIKDGTTVFGASEKDLLIVTRMDFVTFRNLLEEYNAFISALGLELVHYEFEGEKWYCLKSDYYAPPELNKEELILLGTIIAMIENQQKVTLKRVKEFFLTQDLLKEYQIVRSMRELMSMGYLKRKKNKEIIYGYRTILEYGEKERNKIKEEFVKL
ncbi:MAG: hypothetical protein ACTSQE_03505 [Candidatus Heimdallarchaeaceae archaeon]